MEQYIQNLDKMLAAWNSTDVAEIRAPPEAAMEHNVHFVDPNHNIMGLDASLEIATPV